MNRSASATAASGYFTGRLLEIAAFAGDFQAPVGFGAAMIGTSLRWSKDAHNVCA